MRTGSLIAVVIATFVAIGVALAVGLTGNSANALHDFEEIYYTRNVEHDQLPLFGDCPLGREIVVERTGKVRVSWYVQRPDNHGCVPAIDYRPGESIEEMREGAMVARTMTTLGKSDLRELLKGLEALRWEAEWREPKDMDFSSSTGCKRTTDALAGRDLAVVRPGPKIAILSIFGGDPGAIGSDPCAANEVANARTLDAAVAPFVPLLPVRYHLRPAATERLYREP